MKSDFRVSLDYICQCAAYWDYKLMWMARCVQRSYVNLRPYGQEGLRLVRAATDTDRRFQAIDDEITAAKANRSRGQ